MTDSEFLNVRDTARQLGVHENTIRNWQKRGLLSGVKLPGSGFRRFTRTEIDRMRREMFEQYAPTTAELDREEEAKAQAPKPMSND